MYPKSAALLVTMICALPVPALAASPASGNDWLSRCEDGATTGDAAKASYCFSYARGLADGLSIWAVISPETAPVCIPTQVQGQELVDVGMRYLKDHPEMQTLAAGVPLVRSFAETWPCKDAQASASGPSNKRSQRSPD
jgi:hypothetical protein